MHIESVEADIKLTEVTLFADMTEAARPQLGIHDYGGQEIAKVDTEMRQFYICLNCRLLHR